MQKINKNEHKDFIIVSLTEHIGDIILVEPIIRELKLKHPNKKIVWCINAKYKSIISFNLNINEIITVKVFAEWILMNLVFRNFFMIYDLHIDQKPCTRYFIKGTNPNKFNYNSSDVIKCNNLLHFFCISGSLDFITNERPVFYLDPNISTNSIFEKYIVIHAKTNLTSKDWNSTSWNNLIKEISALYPDYQLIEIGQEPQIDSVLKNYSSYCYKLSFQEIGLLIKKCNLFIGLESGFSHLANSFDVKRIILIGEFGNTKSFLNPYSGYHNDINMSIINRFDLSKEVNPSDVLNIISSKHLL